MYCEECAAKAGKYGKYDRLRRKLVKENRLWKKINAEI
jgi:hypothetical protein